MSTSGQGDYNVSGSDIILEALELLGVLAEGESANGFMEETAQRTLNMIVKNWQAEGFNLHTLHKKEVGITDGNNSVDISTVAPDYFEITDVVFYNADTEQYTPMTQMSHDEWFKATYNGSTEESRTPTSWFWNPGGDVSGGDADNVSTMYIWPTLDTTNANDKLIIWGQRNAFGLDAGDSPDYPSYWYLPLAFNLAVALAPKYGVSPARMDRVQMLAREYKETAEGFDREDFVYFSPSKY